MPINGGPRLEDRQALHCAALDVLATILNFGSLACTESALHGLGHWHRAFPERERLDRRLPRHLSCNEAGIAGLCPHCSMRLRAIARNLAFERGTPSQRNTTCLTSRISRSSLASLVGRLNGIDSSRVLARARLKLGSAARRARSARDHCIASPF